VLAEYGRAEAQGRGQAADELLDLFEASPKGAGSG
jgi:hypothetical protein